MPKARALTISRGRIIDALDLDGVALLTELPARRPGSLRSRKAAFDAATYDRLRVLSTELRRVLDEGGEVALAFGTHAIGGAKLASLLREL